MLKKWIPIMLMLLLAVTIFSGNVSHLSAKSYPALPIGSMAPNFTLKEINGEWMTLSDVVSRNRITIVNFWATWCPPCRREIPEFEAFHRANKEYGVAILAVSQENESTVKAFAAQAGMTYSVLSGGNKVEKAYLITVVPTTYLIDNQGRIRDVIFSATDAQTLYEHVMRILNN